jgi:two-component system cell cycle response regulator DivK
MAGEIKKKILVVEDNYQNKVLVREILTLHGFVVTEASTGMEALKALTVDKPDIILMDLHLPQMDGITATRIIRSDAGNAGIPIIALTASAMKGEEEDILKGGFDGCVAKPIEVKRLIETVSRLLGEDGESGA